MNKKENISGGFRTPVYGVVTSIPTCNLCKNRIKISECSYYGECLPKIKKGNAVKCEHEELNVNSPLYNKFIELRKEQSK